MFRELTKQNKTTTFSGDSRVGMMAWIISSWSLTYIRETVCVLFLVKAEVWSSAYSRGDGDQHPFLARSSPGGVGEAVTQPKQSSTTLGSPAALTSPSTARSSSVSRHPPCNLSGLLWVVFLLTTQTQTRRSKSIPRRLLQKCGNGSIGLHMPRGWCF